MNRPNGIIRPDLKPLSPYNAGLSIAEIRAKYGVENVAKLGSNENPFGPAPEVITAISDVAHSVYLYPESNAGILRATVADHYSLEPDNLIFGNGSEELLSIICRSVVDRGDRVVTLYPSFPLHEDYAVMMGGKIERVAVREDLHIDVDALISAVRKPAKMVVFSNPMNPVGSWLSPSELQEVIRNTHPDTLLVLDEAYYEYARTGDYCTGLEFLKHETGNWMVLRTFSKAWGLAGLRVGFAVCSNRALREALDLTRTPFNINILGQVAATSALHHADFMSKHVTQINQERIRVQRRLTELGYEFAPSLGNFLFVDAKQPADALFESLLRLGTIVKPWRQPGFEKYIRISIGTPSNNNQFLDAIRVG